jgi:hypothetical protein
MPAWEDHAMKVKHARRHPMRVIIRPLAEPEREIDMTHRLVAAIAEELWRLYAGNAKLNWLEAERHLARIIGHARDEAPWTVVLPFAPAAPARAAEQAKPCTGGPASRVREPRRLSRARIEPLALGRERRPSVAV